MRDDQENMVHDSPENNKDNNLRSSQGGSSDDASTASAEVTQNSSSLPPPSPISSPSPTMPHSRHNTPPIRYSPRQDDDPEGVHMSQQWQPSRSANGDATRDSRSDSPRSRGSNAHVGPPVSPQESRSRSHSPTKQIPRKTPEFAQPPLNNKSSASQPYSPAARPNSRVRSFSPSEDNRASPAGQEPKGQRPPNQLPRVSPSPQQGVEITGVRTNRANIMNANATALFDGGIKKDRQRAAAHVAPTSAPLEPPVATFHIRRQDIQPAESPQNNNAEPLSPNYGKRPNSQSRDLKPDIDRSPLTSAALHRIHEGGSKEEIEALLDEFRNRRPEIIEEFLHREPAAGVQREAGEAYGMVRAPQQFQHLRSNTPASAIVAVPNLQLHQPSPAKRPRVTSSSVEHAINELGLNQYLQPSGQRSQSQQHSPQSEMQPSEGLVIDITGTDSNDESKTKSSPLGMVNEVLKQLMDLQKKLPLAIKEAQRAQAQLIAIQKPPTLPRSNGTAVVSPVRDEFEIAHAEHQLYRIQQSSMVPTTILNRMEVDSTSSQRKQTENLKSHPPSAAITSSSNGQVAIPSEYQLVTMGVPPHGRDGPMDLTSRTPMLLPTVQHHSNSQPAPRAFQAYQQGPHESQSRSYRPVAGTRPPLHRYNPAVERVSPPVNVERSRRNSIPLSSPPHLSRNGGRGERQQGNVMPTHFRRELVTEAERVRYSSSGNVGHHRPSNQATITVVPLQQQQQQAPQQRPPPPHSNEHVINKIQQQQQQQQQQPQPQQQPPRKHSTSTGHCLQCQRASGFVCSSCKTATYCSRECQNQHWSKHEQECMRLISKDMLSAGSSVVARANQHGRADI